jgi:hypothetical protein
MKHFVCIHNSKVLHLLRLLVDYRSQKLTTAVEGSSRVSQKGHCLAPFTI